MENRAGFFIKQPSGYSSFKPKPLPPENPSVHFDAEMMALMSTAERLLGRLDGVTQTLPNPALYNPDRLNDGRDSGIALYSILQQNGKILNTATEDEKAMLKKVIR